jgi:glycerophosphoryl diester phosphodiesterase
VPGVHPYLDAPRPHLFAHRGASGIAPENTHVAFERAIALGMRFLETDCHATHDGEIVLCHDATLERTTDGEGPIAGHTYAEIAALDAGYRFSPDGHGFPFRGRGVRIPRLEDVLAAWPEARINLEVKQAGPPIAHEVVRLVQKAKAVHRVLLAAESDAILASLRALEPGTALGSSREDVVAFFGALDAGALDAFRPGGHALQIPPRALGRELVTPASIRAAERVGLAMHVWTINDDAEMRRMLRMGVHGVMSDFPDRLLGAARAPDTSA